MGLQCTKVASSNGPKLKPIRASIPSPQRIIPQNKYPEIWIKVQHNPSPRTGQQSPSTTQKFITYSKKIDETCNSVKFDEKVGFFHDKLKKLSSKDEIQFLVSMTENKNFLVSLAGMENKELWKILSPEGMWYDEKDQIQIGKTLLRLKYWLKPEETIKMKNKSQVKLNICKDEKAQCRICLEPATDPENPLVEPCKCIGSVSAIHQRCLSKWIFSNRDSFSQKMCFYRVSVKNWLCEICCSSFRSYIWYRIMSITTYFPGHYAIFQILNQKQQTTQEGPSYAICKFTDQKPRLIVGNVQGADFPLNNANKQQIKLALTKTNAGLFIINQSRQTFPYVLSQTNYLNYNQEYKLRNMYLLVRK